MPLGEARRIFMERLERISRAMQAERDCGDFVASTRTFEEVRQMVYKHLEESRTRREENERRESERRWSGRLPARRLRT